MTDWEAIAADQAMTIALLRTELQDARTEAVALRATEQNLIAALERACNTAMQQSLIARIPECGHFAGIAQDLDWVLDQMPAAIRVRGNT